MIRFTETAKWQDPWFMSLKHGSKLLFFYLIENCDNAGFYEINEKLLCVSLDYTPQQFKGALKALGRGIEGPSEGWLRVKNFLRHQKNAHLNPANPAHRQIIGLLEAQIKRFPSVKTILPDRSPYQGASKGLPSPIGTGTGTGTEDRGSGGKKPKAKPEPLRPHDPQAIQLAACVGRQATTPWDEKEIVLWRKLKPPLEQPQLDRLSLYYAKNRKRENNICRRDLGTLLGHYAGECDRANAWCEKFRKKILKPLPTQDGRAPPLPDPQKEAAYRERWAAWKEAGRPMDPENLKKYFPEETTNEGEQNDPNKQ